ELDWVPCEYDLGITKTASAVDPGTGAVVWTITVTNHGPDAMTRGDVVTITDSLPGPGNSTITEIVAPAGVTCTPGEDATITSPVVCSRPFDGTAHQGAGDGVRGLDVGESLTLRYEQAVTAPGSYPNTATVTDRSNPDNNQDSAVVVVTGPSAGPRTSHGVQGQQQ